VTDRRRLADAVAATVLVVGFVVGPFVLALLWRDSIDVSLALPSGPERAGGRPLPTGDLVRLALVGGWTVASMVVLGRLLRPGPVRHRFWLPFGVEAVGRHVIDQSLFGAGAMMGWRAHQASVHLSDLVGPEVIDIGRRYYGVDDPDRRRRRSTTAARADAGAGSPQTEDRAVAAHEQWNGPVAEHLVGRGDTWWSLASQTLGDGRQWATVRALNVGRRVGPDRVMGEGDQLRRGWLIVVPVVGESSEGVG
jgi:nucleoid-associated protein YgaU